MCGTRKPISKQLTSHFYDSTSKKTIVSTKQYFLEAALWHWWKSWAVKKTIHPEAISSRLNDGASLALHGGQYTTLYHNATGPLPRDWNGPATPTRPAPLPHEANHVIWCNDRVMTQIAGVFSFSLLEATQGDGESTQGCLSQNLRHPI